VVEDEGVARRDVGTGEEEEGGGEGSREEEGEEEEEVADCSSLRR